METSLIKTTDTIERVYLPITLEAKKATALYGFIERCFMKAHDINSDMEISPDEFLVLQKLFHEIEESNILSYA